MPGALVNELNANLGALPDGSPSITKRPNGWMSLTGGRALQATVD